MVKEDLHDANGVLQPWNDKSGKLFWPVPSLWPACITCGPTGCKIVSSFKTFKVGTHPRRMSVDGSLEQGAGEHLEYVTPPSKLSWPPRPVGALRRLAIKSFKSDILKTCAALQSQGNLSGPNESMAAQVVTIFHEVAGALGTTTSEDHLDLIRLAIVNIVMENVEVPLSEHEAHFALFQTSDKRVMSPNEHFRTFCNCCNLSKSYSLLPCFAVEGTWDDFNQEYTRLLKQHFMDCFGHRISHKHRMRARVTANAAHNCLQPEGVFKLEAERHDKKVRIELEEMLRSVLLEIAFPNTCIARLVKTERQLRQSVDLFLKHGDAIFRKHHLGVRETMRGNAGHYASSVVADLRAGMDITESLKKQVLGSSSVPQSQISNDFRKQIADTVTGHVVKKANELEGDVAWLKDIMLKAIKEASTRFGGNAASASREWKGFEEAWYSYPKKNLLFLCSSSTLYSLSRGHERNNAFLMDRPLEYVENTNLQVKHQHTKVHGLLYFLSKSVEGKRASTHEEQCALSLSCPCPPNTAFCTPLPSATQKPKPRHK